MPDFFSRLSVGSGGGFRWAKPRNGRRRTPLHYRFADFEVDVDQKELRRGGQVVHVEPQVFDLLVHLVRHRDRIVTKDELIETIWQGRIVSEAALSSRINSVRRALGDNGNDQLLIRTLHKRGFRFVGEVAEYAPASATADAPEAAATAGGAGREPILLDRAPPLADSGSSKPSIAVLPFEDLSGNAENEYFGYGLTEDLIRLLARNRWLTVISRHSTAGYKARSGDVRQIGAELGVRYILGGSVRKNEDLLRITAELVRAAEGTLLWADSYDLRLDRIFDIQEEMARQIAATIEPELSRVEQQLAARKPPDSLDAWDCFQRGLWNLWAFTTSGFDAAEAYFRRAIEADPQFARAHGALAYVNVQRALYDEPRDRPARLDLALRQAKESVALDERDCFCHCALGRALCLLQRNDEAAAALDTSIDLNPSFAQAYFAQGFNLLWYGRAIDAEALLDRATMLSPRDSHLWSFHHVRAWVHFSLGEYGAAAEFAGRAVRQPNVTYRAFATLAAALGQGGDRAEARAAAAELLKRKADYRGATARKELFFCKDPDFIERYTDGLRVAGIAER